MSRSSLLFLVLAFLLVKAQVSALSDHQDHFREISKNEILLTLEIANGDIVDCIVKNKKQHSLSNHLFKNNTIQSVSRKWQEDLKNEAQASTKETFQILFNTTTKCPKGSVPNLRTKRNTITKTKLVVSENTRRTLNRHLVKARKFVNDPSHGNDQDGNETSGDEEDDNEDDDETAIVGINITTGIKGIRVRMNVWHPTLESDNEFSSSHIWLLAGGREDIGEELNIIGAGYHVDPSETLDNRTRLFGYWTRNGNPGSGGYNLATGGFHPVNPRVYLGVPLPGSIYGGPQRHMLVSIYKGRVGDRADAGWWLKVQNTKVGYWPIDNFTHLRGLATRVDLIGHVRNLRRDHRDRRHTKTQMGSGYLPREGYGRAAYFSKIEVMGANNIYVPVSRGQLSTRISSPDCYTIKFFDNFATNDGAGFFYGGPGYNETNPRICP